MSHGGIAVNHGQYISFGPGNSNIVIRRGGYYGRYYSPWYDRYYRRYDVPDTATLVELARRYDPQLLGAEANAEPPTDRQRGEHALRAGRYADAVAFLASAADAEQRDIEEGAQPVRQAQRLLGIAYASNREFEKAAEMLVDAFEVDPTLRNLPLRGADLFGPGLELNTITSRAVGYAHRHPSYGSWFTVAVLMQAQGKTDLANQMIERAEAARAAEQHTPTEPSGEAAPAAPERVEPVKRERRPETEAERLRRDLERSTERMLETQRRLEEMERKQGSSGESDG